MPSVSTYFVLYFIVKSNNADALRASVMPRGRSRLLTELFEGVVACAARHETTQGASWQKAFRRLLANSAVCRLPMGFGV
eukprot:scaffold47511_cov21-Prasinocladus_malaysianus.AAC.1